MSVLNVKHFLLLEAVVLVLGNTETVHSDSPQSFTNNFTTYRLNVPGSHDPITIIEEISHASKLSDRQAENTNRGAEKKMLVRRTGDRFTEKELVSLSPSAEQRLNNRNQDVHATLSFQISNPDTPHEDDDDKGDVDQKKNSYPPSLLKKFIKDYSDKIKNADESTKNALKEIEKINQKHTNAEEEVTTDRMDFSSDDEIEQKYSKWNDRYSHKHQSQSNPYNDKDGWVTLEAVPWSSSKVSKWYPNSNKFSHKNSYDSPLSHQTSYGDDDDKYHNSFPKPRPPPSYHDEFNDDYADDHPTLKPVYTSYDAYRPPQTNNRPQYSWSQNQNTGYEKRPTYKPRPQYDFNQQSNSNNQHQWYDDDRHDVSDYYDVDRNTPKPWSQDIITDNRPSNFPYRTPSKRPHSSDRDPTKYHPFSHPDNGNGEWVLVSTTKGYQAPKRSGKRALNLTNIQANDLLSHHSVKLTVLPAKNNTFSYDHKPMKLSHGGLLEVESSFESVEDSAALTNSGNKPLVVKKRKVYRNVPMTKGITTSNDGPAMLAAVGAGMIPATMAMLMPMVLGRRRRSVDDSVVPSATLVVRDFK
ncbi:hypothetical protein HA402_006977 [Bradysia odoriphaga]|nr:hypothetical protein HA402_006977 [Bradysia odoriphaga]